MYIAVKNFMKAKFISDVIKLGDIKHKHFNSRID